MAQQIPHYGLAILVAPLAGGPGFIAGFGLLDLIEQFPNAIALTSKDMTDFLAVMAVSTIGGWFFAFLPCLIGTILMAGLGATKKWARAPILWALAGALPAVVISLIKESFTDEALTGIALFSIPGILCALICRLLTRWHDAKPLAAKLKPVVLPAVAV